MKTNFKISDELIEAGKTVFLAMAYTQTIRPVIENYQRKILEKHQFRINPKFLERGMADEPITDPEYCYLITDEDFKTYLQEVHEQHIKHGFHVKFEYCPLLIAESMERNAKRELLRAAQYITNINPDNYIPLKLYEQLIELTLQLVSPYVDGKQVLKELETYKPQYYLEGDIKP